MVLQGGGESRGRGMNSMIKQLNINIQTVALESNKFGSQFASKAQLEACSQVCN